MSRRTELTVEEVEARERGWVEAVDWIVAERTRRSEAAAAALAAPLVTPAGTIEVGKWYDITARKYGKTRRYKRVTLDRSGYGARLRYDSRVTAQNLYGRDAESITSIEEVS